jgi:hypothetical protein
MIEFLFFFCLPMATGESDCSYKVYMANLDEINDLWTSLGNKGTVAALSSMELKSIYIASYNTLNHEFFHMACENYYDTHNSQNHSYCAKFPHFKVQR